jgi:hypothetical protein
MKISKPGYDKGLVEASYNNSYPSSAAEDPQSSH